MTSRNRTLLVLAVAAVAMAAFVFTSSAQAAVIYESFSQPAGGLNGATGATGLSNWTSTAPNVIASPTLSYGILPNAGNQVNVPSGQGTGNASATTTALSGAGLLDNGATIWFSVVTTGATGSNQHSGFALGTAPIAPSFDGARLNGDAVGFYTRQNSVRAAVWSPGGNLLPDSLSGTLSAPAASTNFVVGKVEWGATAGDVETITLYTPSLADLVLPGTSVSTTVTGFDQTALNTISFASRQGAQSFDEIRFGASYDDVIGAGDTVIPEPSTFLIWSLGLLGLIGWRRRRTR